jgi:uracil-DNA glycosylase family 4
VVSCTRCPRLRAYCREVARVKRRAFADQEYWGKPVPGFGDPRARLLLLGLAPAAHGGNRTGRVFTGDRSGDFLFAALHRLGLANQALSIAREDGLKLRGVYVAAAARCAPPDNLPSRDELDRCAPYLTRELSLLSRLGCAVALGAIAWEALLRLSMEVDPASVPRPRPRFGHGAVCRLPLRPGAAPLPVVGVYHPSQQNTQTGKLTPAMFDAGLRKALALAGSYDSPRAASVAGRSARSGSRTSGPA